MNFESRTTTKDTIVHQAHSAMAEARTQFERYLASLERDRYSAEGLLVEISRFIDSKDAQAVKAAVDQVRQRREQAQADVDRIRRNLTPPGDVATELRASRYWQRTQRILDSVESGRAIAKAQDLVRTADCSELATLLTELEPYFTARGQATDWIEPTVARIVPEYGSAREQLKRAGQALQIAEYNAKALHEGFSTGRAPKVLADPTRYDPDS